jgi:hypothetical protein
MNGRSRCAEICLPRRWVEIGCDDTQAAGATRVSVNEMTLPCLFGMEAPIRTTHAHDKALVYPSATCRTPGPIRVTLKRRT